MLNWLWRIRHRKLIEETRRLINFKIFLENELKIKYNFSIRELKAGLKALTLSSEDRSIDKKF